MCVEKDGFIMYAIHSALLMLGLMFYVAPVIWLTVVELCRISQIFAIYHLISFTITNVSIQSLSEQIISPYDT